jgi:hypothetical protein
MTGPSQHKPKGLRRLERWVVGLLMGVLAFVLEKIVMRTIRKDGGGPVNTGAGGSTVTTKGVDVEIEE